jgi:hypothetical protein
MGYAVAIAVTGRGLGCWGWRGAAQILQYFGSSLIFRVEAALAVIDASLARVLASALLLVSGYFLAHANRKGP